MPNVSRTNIIRIGKALLCTYSEIKTQTCFRPGQSNGTLPQISFGNNHYLPIRLANMNLRFYEYKVQSRCFSNDSGSEEPDYNQQTSSSSFYQQYNRDSYERKRSKSEKAKANNENNNANKTTQMMNHYQRLNIDPESDTDAIKSAYYSLSKIYHPDTTGLDKHDSAENFRLITESYDTLSNPELRAVYDNELNSYSSISDLVDSRHPHKDFNPLYRTRDSNAIFKSRQAALQREKSLNPKKFRAGAFKEPDGTSKRFITEDEIIRLKRQIDSVEGKFKTGSFNRESRDDEFYSMHMYDILQRRHTDLLYHQKFSKEQDDSKSEDIFVGLATVAAVIVALFLIGLNVLFEIDFAGVLDQKLREALDKNPSEENTEIDIEE